MVDATYATDRRPAPSVPARGFVFERDPGHFVGAVGMNTIVTFGLILISILVGLWALWPDMDFVGLASVPLLIAVVVPRSSTPRPRRCGSAST